MGGIGSVAVVGAAVVSTTGVHVASDVMQIPIWVEMFTVVAASAAGAMTARTVRLDLLGTIMLAIVTGLAGGLLRDMIMQVGNVYILKQPLALPMSCLTGLIIFFAPLRGRRVILFMQAIDILNIGLYAAMGADKAFAYGFDVPACILLGAITGVGGGLFRDICLSVRPALFTAGGNFYGIAAIIGTVGYLVARSVADLDPTLSAIVCVVVTIVVRWASVRFDIVSPAPVDLTAAAVRKVRKYRRSEGVRDRRGARIPSVLRVRKPGVKGSAPAGDADATPERAATSASDAARRASSSPHECFSDEAIEENVGLEFDERESSALTAAWEEHVARYANSKPAAVPCFHEEALMDDEVPAEKPAGKR